MPADSSVEKVTRVVEYIEDNIYENISLNDIALYANLSKFHLHKTFKALTGKKLMNYVRNRKLTHSINELLNTNLKIIDIACEYNFKYEQTYIRSFKKVFKISPDKFRKEKYILQVYEKIDLKHITKP